MRAGPTGSQGTAARAAKGWRNVRVCQRVLTERLVLFQGNMLWCSGHGVQVLEGLVSR
ncbi:hypothetical protein GCM10018779_67630 [Streptomyces griseocarneus]|nr:hypothetical protein GCM10018779_67630 [Streptomyces griseocarneus]